MAISRREKEKEVQDLKEKFSKIKSAVLTNYTGLSVSDIQDLRKKLREENIDYKISKNTLIKLAVKDSNIDIDPEIFDGQMAVAYGYNDEIMPAKIIYTFFKEHEKPEILGGIFEGKYINKEFTEQLALIPGREELHAKFVNVLAGPIIGFQNVLMGNIRSIVSVLAQYKSLLDQ
jgi:large subunit ribosomal protein L10